MNNYPLYPELPEGAAEQVQALVDKFKLHLTKVAEEVIGDLYVNIACHVESDSWSNYRNELMDGFRNYDNRLVQGEYDFKKIRAEIYKDFRDDIIKDLNQDNIARIAELEEIIACMRDYSLRYS